MVQWHLVVTAPGREKLAIKNLTRQKIDCFCPEFTRRYRRVKDGKTSIHEKELPLFPGYLFVERPDHKLGFSRAQKGQSPVQDAQKGEKLSGLKLVEWLGDIEATDGIHGFVRFGAYPIIVSDKVVSDLRHAMVLGCFVEDEKKKKVGYLGDTRAQAWRTEPQRDAFLRMMPSYLQEKGCDGVDADDVDADKARFAVGENVKIIDGPLSLFVAKIIEAPAKDRIKVILNLFGRQTEVSLEMAQIEALT